MLELESSVFIIPGEQIKNGEERLVVLNRVAASVIESVRGQHQVYVFVHTRKKNGEPAPVLKINNTAWKAARERAADKWTEQCGEAAPAGFRSIRVHDLKHPFGRRENLCDAVLQNPRNDVAAAQERLAGGAKSLI